LLKTVPFDEFHLRFFLNFQIKVQMQTLKVSVAGLLVVFLFKNDKI